jgi:hypothetical protein
VIKVEDGSLLFTQWKGHPPLPLDRELQLRVDAGPLLAIAKAVAVSPYTYRIAVPDLQ